MNNPTLAMIGYGVVGRATAEAFHTKGLKVIGIDPKVFPKSNIEHAFAADMAFICVPTPMFPTSSKQDLEILHGVIADLSLMEYKGLIIIKSTVLPSAVKDFCEEYAHLKICTNPEFLTERYAARDAADPHQIVIGGGAVTDPLAELYGRLWGLRPLTLRMSAPGAMLYKYIYNILGAVTVSACNDFYAMHEALGLDDWNSIQYAMQMNPMFDSRTKVPGPDGKLGFGGNCYPKDLSAIINMALDLDVPANTLKGSWATNLVVRGED